MININYISIIFVNSFQVQAIICTIDYFILIKVQAIHQCPHYQRNCMVEAPCCKVFYFCKACHDQSLKCSTQRMQFEKVANIKCLNCNYIQVPSQKCCKCSIKFGEYFCLKCRLYENDPKKVNDIYHCDNCKMCRRGKQSESVHCFKCGWCIKKCYENNHKCFENNSQSQCPVCLQLIFFSIKSICTLRCGHVMHASCKAMLKSVNCPFCGMAFAQMSKMQIEKIDELIRNNPVDNSKKVKILCNECLHKTPNANFHHYGNKCQKCGSYNTKII